jgi:hypothetical protein
VKLAICVVSNRDHNADFTMSLINMLAWLSLGQHPFEWFTLQIKTGCSLLPAARQETFDDCYEKGATHALCLDDDMTFPPETAVRLAAHDKPFVACNSLRKNPKSLIYTARSLDSKMVRSKDRTGLEEVGRVGLAIALIDLRVLAKIEKPHFEIKWHTARQNYVGEDMYFCDKWRKAGNKIYVDHGLSNECGHIGSMVYKFDIYQDAPVKAHSEAA